jgi:lysyl-tRNA synthetase, class II
MASLEEIRQSRLAKLKLLEDKGITPYPAHTKREYSLAELDAQFDVFKKEGKIVVVAGRIMSLRPQGGLIFFHLYDGTAKFQGLLKKEEVSGEIFL